MRVEFVRIVVEQFLDVVTGGAFGIAPGQGCYQMLHRILRVEPQYLLVTGNGFLGRTSSQQGISEKLMRRRIVRFQSDCAPVGCNGLVDPAQLLKGIAKA